MYFRKPQDSHSQLRHQPCLPGLQARYLVERQSNDLWACVLDDGNEHRRHVIDQVVSTALPESQNPDEVYGRTGKGCVVWNKPTYWECFCSSGRDSILRKSSRPCLPMVFYVGIDGICEHCVVSE